MKIQYDFKKEWPQLKKQLARISDDARVMMKKGEKELVKFSRESKRHLDVTALQLKKEHLYHLIGKEYLKAGCPGEPSAPLKSLVAEFQNIEKDITALSRRQKTSGSTRTARKTRKSKPAPTAQG